MKLSIDWPAVLAGLEGDELRDALLMLADELPEREARWVRRRARAGGLRPNAVPIDENNRWLSPRGKHLAGRDCWSWIDPAYVASRNENYSHHYAVMTSRVYRRLRGPKCYRTKLYVTAADAWADLLHVLSSPK